MIVMNEKKYIDNITKEDFCKKIRYNVSLLVKKFYEVTDDKKEIIQMVLDYMDNVVDDFMEEKWINFIEKTVNKMEGEKLNYVDGISITDKEIGIIRTLDTRNEKYLLFTLIVLAKLRNMMNPENNNWVTYGTSEIFKTANVKISRVEQDLLIKELRDRGFIEYANKVDNLSIRVVCILDGECVISVNELNKVGNKYYDYERLCDGYKPCAECGKFYMPKSPTHTYCNLCGRMIRNENKLKWWHNTRTP